MTTPARHHFAGVTLLVTHYNRSGSLQRLLAGFDQLDCSFDDVVVSDDGSRPEHRQLLETLQTQYGFRLITTPVNRGLGHNINKGQDAVTTAYTLYVQEDFVPKPAFVPRFGEALALMNQDRTLDTVRFYAYFPYPYLKPYANGFSEMVFKAMPWYANHLKFYYYSDHPHLRRRSFFDKFGRYIEGKNGDKTEFAMCLSYLRNKGKGLFFDAFTTIFDQENSAVEPSTATFRTERTYSESVYVPLRSMYLVYRLLKNSVELALFAPTNPVSSKAD
ncbi:MAG: glycosyltransferase family 2 protein [Bacteroidetes bacterium]|nr:glycosyltransferase family 2 protein [Fibrella sp.]